MADENKGGAKKGGKASWGGFKGIIVKGSLKEDGDKLEAMGKTAEGKEHRVVAYPQNPTAAQQLREAEASGAEIDLGGPMLGGANGSFHFGVGSIKPAAAPKPKLSDEEKAAAEAERKAAAAVRRAEDDKSRVPVVVGSVKVDGSVEVNGETMTVTALGGTWTLDDEAAVEVLAKRFPHVEGLKVGDEVQFAKFEEPSPSPSM